MNGENQNAIDDKARDFSVLFATHAMPRSAGELLSDGVSLLRRHIRVLLGVSIPFAALDLLFREAAAMPLQGLATFAVSSIARTVGVTTTAPVPMPDNIAALFSLSAMLFILSRISVLFITASAIAVVLSTVSDDKIRRQTIFTRVRAVFPAIVVADIVFAVVLLVIVCVLPVVVGALAFIVSDIVIIGVLLGLGALGVAVLLSVVVYLNWALNAACVLAENRGPFAALARSRQIMASSGAKALRGPRSRLGLLVAVYWAIASGVQSTFMLPLVVVGWVVGSESAVPSLVDVPLYAAVPIALVEVVANALILPLGGVFLGVFYKDARLRQEGQMPAQALAQAVV
jgi:hypothetical protein